MTAFSVVIPTFNAEGTLAAALTSVERQTERDVEVIVVDDGSTDGTVAVAKRACADRGWSVLEQPNAGPSAARNRGIRAAQGRWIALLDADDWLLPRHLATLRGLLEDEPGTGLVFTDAWVYDEQRRRFGRWGASAPYRPAPTPTEHWAVFRALMWVNFVFVANAFPRDLVLELGGFNEAIRASEDWELWLRIAAAGAPVRWTAERTAVYRHRPGQASADKTFMWNGLGQTLRSVQKRCDLPEDVARDLAERLRVHEASSPASDPLPRSGLRDLAGRATRWTRPVRDFRLRAPAEVVGTVGDLL